MSTIRKQTIISSILVYLGFGFGAISMLFFTKKGYFTEEQFGLSTIFYSFSQLALVFSTFGLNTVIIKFYPYYKDNLSKKEIDLISWSFLIICLGFGIVCIAGFFLQPYIIKSYIEKSKLLVDYYILLFPFAFGALVFTLFEAYSFSLKKAIVPSFLRETLFKFLNLIIVLLFCFKLINFTVFMYLFMSLNLITAACLITYIYKIGELHFSFKLSRVTKKFWKKNV